MTRDNILLSKGSRTQKDTDRMSPCVRTSRTGKATETGSRLVVARSGGGGKGGPLVGTGFPFGVIKTLCS